MEVNIITHAPSPIHHLSTAPLPINISNLLFLLPQTAWTPHRYLRIRRHRHILLIRQPDDLSHPLLLMAGSKACSSVRQWGSVQKIKAGALVEIDGWDEWDIGFERERVGDGL